MEAGRHTLDHGDAVTLSLVTCSRMNAETLRRFYQSLPDF